MHPNLSFEQAPPISVPYRFFLTAPLFGVAAGLLLAWTGDEVLASRWTPAALALTHLLVAGFLLQAMCGALLQFIPVAAGGNIWRPRFIAGIVHPALVIGSLSLAGGFLAGPGFLLAAGAGLLATALSGYALVTALALFRTPASGSSILSLRLAVIGLAVTAVLGYTLVDGLLRGSALPLIQLTYVHAAWGLGGWALMLLSGVSYLVVPMFQLTPAYPAWLGRWLPWTLLALLILWSGQLSGYLPEIIADGHAWVLLAGLGSSSLFAMQTLHLQARRRRRVPDVTLIFFRIAMSSLLAVFVSALAFQLLPELGAQPRTAAWLGVLVIFGVFVSAISGMLYKIVPFLNWLHLQRLGGLSMPPPNMKEMIGDRATFGHLRLHLVALFALLGAVLLPSLAPLAGLLLAASCGWLQWNLVGAVRVFRLARDRIRADAACHVP